MDLEASIQAQEQRFAHLRRLTKQEDKSFDPQLRQQHFARFDEEDRAEQQLRADQESRRQAAEAAEKVRSASRSAQLRVRVLMAILLLATAPVAGGAASSARG